MCTEEDLAMEQEIKRRIIYSNPMFARAKSEVGTGQNLLARRRKMPIEMFKYNQQQKSSPTRYRNFSVNEKLISNNDSDEEDATSHDPILNLPHMCMQVKQKQNLEKLLQVSKKKVK